MIWDLLHYGWPDHVDIWSADFAPRFAAFAAAAARLIGPRTRGTRFYAPVKSPSSPWGGGDAAYLNPFARGRGFELKVQLARAAIAAMEAMEAILAVDPAARFVHADPVINVVADPARPWDAPHAEGHRQAQYQGWDLLAGRLWPQIGGRPALLDVVGINYYHNNQWIHGGPPIDRHHPLYRPLHRILAETHARYGRPIFIAETGSRAMSAPTGSLISAPRCAARSRSACRWRASASTRSSERYCANGLLHDEKIGPRRAFQPLVDELRRQRATGFYPAAAPAISTAKPIHIAESTLREATPPSLQRRLEPISTALRDAARGERHGSQPPPG